ncbi:MAG: hypothetical protein V1928_00205 [Parcubacteria group bacterium]
MNDLTAHGPALTAIFNNLIFWIGIIVFFYVVLNLLRSFITTAFCLAFMSKFDAMELETKKVFIKFIVGKKEMRRKIFEKLNIQYSDSDMKDFDS